MERRGLRPAVGVLLAVVAGATVDATFRPWTLTVGSDGLPTAQSVWATGGVAAVGAAFLVLGAVLATACAFVAGRPRSEFGTVLALVGGAGAVIGAALLVSEHHAFSAVDRWSAVDGDPFSGTDPGVVVPTGAVWVPVAAVAVCALLFVVVASQQRAPSPRPEVAVAVVGAPATLGLVLLVVATSALPWGGTGLLSGASLWRSGPTAVTGGALVVAGAVLTLVAVVRTLAPAHRSGFAAAALVGSALGLAVLVSSRVDRLRGDADSVTVGTGGSLLVLGGGLLVVVVAAVAVWLYVPSTQPVDHRPLGQRVTAA